ncbi:alkaline phosphatase family protein [Streptomyces lasalocidi]
MTLAGGSLAAASELDGSSSAPRKTATAKHVLLLSVDGLHQSDLAWYVTRHPGSALARLVNSGVHYTNAHTTTPSDSFPGMTAQVTGGGPGTTGIYYDDVYNHALLPASTTHCKGVKPGVEVDMTEDMDKNKASLDAEPGPEEPARQHPADDRPTAEPARPDQAARRPHDLQAGLPALVPAGEHRLQRGPQGRTAHRLVGQAHRLRHPQRPFGHGHPGPVLPGDQQRRQRLPGRERLDHRQQGHRAVRQLQGQGRPQRDRRLRPQRQPQGRHPCDLRHELPVGLHRAEAAHLRRPQGRLRRQEHPRPAAAEEPRLRQHPGRRDGQGDPGQGPGLQHGHHPVRQARPVAHRSHGPDPHRRRSAARPAQRRLEEEAPGSPATSSRTPWTTTACCCG